MSFSSPPTRPPPILRSSISIPITSTAPITSSRLSVAAPIRQPTNHSNGLDHTFASSTTATPSVAASSSSSSSLPPTSGTLIRTNSFAKPCCVVGCATKREKEGYCIPHYLIFKQDAPNPSAAAKPTSSSSSSSSTGGDRGGKSWWRRSSTGTPTTFGGCFSTDQDGPQRNGSANMIRNPIPESELLKEVRAAWKSAFKVVFKDLPRLAKRTSVQTEEIGTLIEAGRIIRIPYPAASRASLSSNVAPASTSSSSSTSTGAIAAVRPPRQLRARSIGSWKAWQGMENESWSGREEIRRRNKELEREEQRETEQAAVEEQKGGEIQPTLPYIDMHLSDKEIDTWQGVCNVLLCVLEQLEPTEVVFAARSALAVAASNMHAGTDHQSILENIFTSIITIQSRTFKIFQAIHQAILFPAIAHLHAHLYSHPAIGTLKDCRRSDGWTVLIYIGAAIYATHQRWEQSLHPETDPRHFEVCWEMRLSFDKQMDQLRAVILRIQELKFHPDASADYRQQIANVLAGSGYIV